MQASPRNSAASVRVGDRRSPRTDTALEGAARRVLRREGDVPGQAGVSPRTRACGFRASPTACSRRKPTRTKPGSSLHRRPRWRRHFHLCVLFDPDASGEASGRRASPGASACARSRWAARAPATWDRVHKLDGSSPSTAMRSISCARLSARSIAQIIESGQDRPSLGSQLYHTLHRQQDLFFVVAARR